MDKRLKAFGWSSKRTQEITLSFDFTGEDFRELAGPTEREIVINAAEPWPESIHKGQAVDLSINGYSWIARVKWRRTNRLVLLAWPVI